MISTNKLLSVFCDTFELKPDIDTATLIYNELPEWDSVGHMRLIAAIEEAFDVMLDTNDVLDLSSFDKACEILARHDVKTSA